MKAFALLICILTAGLSSGQKQVLHQKQIWYKYNLKVPIGDYWQISQEFDDRNFIDPTRQSQFLTRTHLQRKLGKEWSVALGFAYFVHSLPQEPEIQDFYNISELRPSVEIVNNTSLSNKFHLHHRYWTEFRFFRQPGEVYEFTTIRIRYKQDSLVRVGISRFDTSLIHRRSAVEINLPTICALYAGRQHGAYRKLSGP